MITLLIMIVYDSSTNSTGVIMMTMKIVVMILTEGRQGPVGVRGQDERGRHQK